MADFGKDYKVPKVNEQKMKVPAKQGGNTDIKMKNPARVGAQKNPAANPQLGREFSAEKDFGTLYAAKQIQLNKGRYGKAMAFGLSLKKSGGPVGERKGPNNAGVRTKAVNSFDNVKGASKPNNGTKMDGGKGRW